QRLCARQRSLHAGRRAASCRRGLQRHPGLAELLPRGLDRAALRERSALHDGEMDGDPDHRHSAAARRREAARQPAWPLCQRPQLVAGDGTMTTPVPERNSDCGTTSLRKSALTLVLVSATTLAGCATYRSE